MKRKQLLDALVIDMEVALLLPKLKQGVDRVGGALSKGARIGIKFTFKKKKFLILNLS